MAGMARKGLRKSPIKTLPVHPPKPTRKGKAKRKVKVTFNSPKTIKVTY